MTSARRLIPAALLACALAGCSASTDGHGSSSAGHPATHASTPISSTPAGSTSATAPASTGKPPTKAALAAMVLQAADLPSVWKGDGSAGPDTSGGNDQAKIAKCVGGKDTTADELYEMDSDAYDYGDSEIDSSATAMKSQAAIDADAAMVSSPKLNSCFAALGRSELAHGMPSGTTIVHISTHVTPGPGGGPSNVVGTLTATITLQTKGQTVPLYLTNVFITGPLVEVSIDFTGVGAPIDAGLQQQLVRTVAKRVQG